MRSLYEPSTDHAGYIDCVLESGDDYEPYGYAALELSAGGTVTQRRNTAFDRVIEAQLLADGSMVGC